MEQDNTIDIKTKFSYDSSDLDLVVSKLQQIKQLLIELQKLGLRLGGDEVYQYINEDGVPVLLKREYSRK